MIRIMQINQGEQFGGVSAMMLQYYKHLNHNRFQYDFVAPHKSSLSQFRSEIELMGGRVIELGACGNIFVRKLRFWKRLANLIQNNKYKIIHINSGSVLFNVQCAWIAKRCRVKKIIVHSHNAGTDGTIKQRIMHLSRFLLEFFATDFWACSERAAAYMFTKKRFQSGEYCIINNGIDIKTFHFRLDVRKSYRNDLGIGSKTVLLHVGRFCPQKNHRLLIKVFKKYLSMHPDTVLVLVGEGELLENVKQQAIELGIQDYVRFLGQRSDVPQLMMAADVFMLPSLYEGLPVVGVEAQATGLSCVFSNEITREVDLIPGNSFVSLDAPIEKWCFAIEKVCNASVKRDDCAAIVAEKGYDIEQNATDMEKKYADGVVNKN